MLRCGRKILRSVSSLEQIQSRTIFSQTGKWPKEYNSETRKKLEQHWKTILQDQHAQNACRNKDKQKYYVLSMFPYPSGKLHMGHVRVYAISDTMARYHRLTGKHVVHPMGWDAFGLPAENAAIERGELPDKWTSSNIANMKLQLLDLCCSFDWDREYATCDPSHYRWTQYIFLKMYEAGLVYQKEAAVNWDPVDQTVLADEQIDDNDCSWRSGAKVETKFLKQWYIKTTAYYKSLLDGLEEVNPDMWQDIIDLQRHWLGECNGTRIHFKLKDGERELEDVFSVFTSTPEAIYGASHISLSPQHYLNNPAYYQESPNKEENNVIKLTLKAVHPMTGEALPLYVESQRDFGEHLEAIIGIPSISEDDRLFAKGHDLAFTDVLSEDGQTLVNSQQFSGLKRQEAFDAVTKYAKELKCGGDLLSERGRDWLISRQRYWGTPIPIIHCPKYGAMPVPYEDLPVTLPKVTTFTGKGASPLAQATDWLKVKCLRCDCDGYAERETDTMDTFVDSSWYYLRYLDPNNETEPVGKDKAHHFMPVDLYIGGKEHAIMHMYYARFFNHFLYDIGLSPQREPFVNLLTQGMVMGRSYQVKDTGQYLRPEQVDTTGKIPVEKGTGKTVVTQWEKMSKSKYNGVDPQEILEEYGCDSTRLCILSNVSPQSDRHWNPDAFRGVVRWQSRMWALVHSFLQQRHSGAPCELSEQELLEYEGLISDERNYFTQQVTFHLETTFLLSVAISRLMGLTSALKKVPVEVRGRSPQFERALSDLIVMTSAFAPMFSSELWAGMVAAESKLYVRERDSSVFEQAWPDVDPDFRRNLKVKINDKEIFQLKLPMVHTETHTLNKDWALSLAQEHPAYRHSLDGVTVKDTLLSVDPVLCELIFVAPQKMKGGARAKKRAQRLKASLVS